jgi:hypothetical protein
VPLPSVPLPQIPAAARMLGINPPTCVQVALVKIPRARRGRGARRRTPTAIGIGGINPSAPVQVAPVIILAAPLGVGCACVPRHRDHSCRQRGQGPKIPKRMMYLPNRDRQSRSASSYDGVHTCQHECQSRPSAWHRLLLLKPRLSFRREGARIGIATANQLYQFLRMQLVATGAVSILLRHRALIPTIGAHVSTR